MSPFPYHLPLCAFSHRCSKRPWSLFLGIFIILAFLGLLLPFLFGRIMVIETFISVCATDLPPYISLNFAQNQRKVYREVLIAGDLSKEDREGVPTYFVS